MIKIKKAFPADPDRGCCGCAEERTSACGIKDMPVTGRLLQDAVEAKEVLEDLSGEQKSAVLMTMAGCLEEQCKEILAANEKDAEKARDSISEVMLDRLKLTEARIKDMAEGLRAVAALPDPAGVVLSSHSLPNGLKVDKISVPLGVVAIIYESRPNVTSDAAGLSFKAGSACVLRGGKESVNSNEAIVKALQQALAIHGLPRALVSLVIDKGRAGAEELMRAKGYVDLLIPRGGAALIKNCVENAKVPCIETGTGICHIYVDRAADMEKALNIAENAKVTRPSVCNAAEVCLVHKDIAGEFLPALAQRLVEQRKAKGLIPVELRLDESAVKIIHGRAAEEGDFDTEFLDYILAVKVVENAQEAVKHINAHSTGHSEAIVTEDAAAGEYFARRIDSACVYVNASTRFTDGNQFGLGCEMGISTQKLHARGPMGLAELMSYKYIIRGSGQIR